MGYVRKIHGSLIKVDSTTYVGEENYLFYDIDTACIRISDGTPGGRPACIEGAAGSVVWGGVLGDITNQTDLVALLNTYVPLSQKGIALGVATLDIDGKIVASQLPAPFAASPFNNITATTVVDSAIATMGKWIVVATEIATPTNIYSTEISAIHNGTTIDFARSNILSLGSAITGLDISVSVTGGNTLNLNITSTSAVNVKVYRVMVA